MLSPLLEAIKRPKSLNEENLIQSDPFTSVCGRAVSVKEREDNKTALSVAEYFDRGDSASTERAAIR